MNTFILVPNTVLFAWGFGVTTCLKSIPFMLMNKNTVVGTEVFSGKQIKPCDSLFALSLIEQIGNNTEVT